MHQRAEGQKRFYRIEAEPLLETAEALRELVGRQHREAASSASPVETAELLEPAQSTEPVRIVSQEAPEPQEGAQPAAPAEQTPVEQRSPAAQQARFPQQPAASADEAVVGRPPWPLRRPHQRPRRRRRSAWTRSARCRTGSPRLAGAA